MDDHSQISLNELRQIAKQQLVSFGRFGVRQLPKPTGAVSLMLSDPPTETSTAADTLAAESVSPPVETVRAEPPASPAVEATADVAAGLFETYSSSLELADRESVFRELRQEIAACTRCEELSRCRTQTVFGVGTLQPRLVFLGEGPGADEDRQGEPFVGRAGQLLTKIIGAMKLRREDVFILNTVKCRPPMNRNPSETELSHCWNYLERQLDVLRPEIICCLGSVAARTLLRTTKSIGRLRGEFYRYKESQVLVTYHPAYLLRSENQTFRGKSPKRMVWDDMKLIMAKLGISVN